MLTLAYILDLVIGDPRYVPHPVKVMGWGVTKMENFLRRTLKRLDNRTQSTEHRQREKERGEKWAGVILVLIIVSSTYVMFYAVNSLFTIHYSLFTALFMIYLISTTLATHELIRSAKAVIKSLSADNIYEARENLSHIVGRDTKSLDSKGIAKAAIETLAENASDGIVAPLFYFAIGGLPLAMAYKAVNTLDSMVGYKNEEYRNFGWAGARLDDIANFIPARITGILIVAATFILGIRGWGLGVGKETNPQPPIPNPLSSFKMMIRDGRNHTSPNSGVPEAAMAGALGVRLGGPSLYGGIVVEKPFIGEAKTEDYLPASLRAMDIVRVTSLGGVIVALVILIVRGLI
ncbi:MAG: cobalamin biosynthesis protein CobD [Nitrospirae bacterium]|nr:cobalamin biosynthesis protein CobD [Nitrospirota bacterium]